MGYLSLAVTSFAQNCSLVWCDHEREAAVIDPGGEAQQIVAAITAQRLRPTMVLLTHGHIDHVGAAVEISAHYAVPIMGPHQQDRFWLQMLERQAEMFGLPAVRQFSPDRWLQQGDSIAVGRHLLTALHCPGHTPGHLVFYAEQEKLLFAGDVLFRGAIGRTDLPGGDHRQLIDSIREQLWPLPDDVVVIPGHGPNTTIGIERATNPFVAE